MTTISSLDFEDQTDGASLTLPSGWTQSGSGSAFMADDAAAMHGILGARLPAVPTSFRRLQYTDGVSASTVRVVSAYVTFRTLVSTNQYFLAANNATVGVGDVRVNATKTISLRNGTTAVATSTYVVTTGVEYRFEWRLNLALHTQELRCYSADSTTALFTLTGALTASVVTGAYYGLTSVAAGYAADYDCLVYADDWVGPWVDSPPPVTYDPPFPVPTIIAHRGGNPGPEETMRAYRASYAGAPNTVAEGDLHLLASGTLVLNHDTTIDRLADPTFSEFVTGAVASFEAHHWSNIYWADPLDIAPEHAMFYSELVADTKVGLGGQQEGRLLALEINTSVDYNLALLNLEASDVWDQLLVQSFSMNAAVESASRGFATMWLGPDPDFSVLVASGIKYWGVNKTQVDDDYAIIEEAHAAGLKVWVFTINTVEERDIWINDAGVDGIFTDEPVLLMIPDEVPPSYFGPGIPI